MRIFFYCHDFKKENLRLMPWRYLHEVAKGLMHRGHSVSFFSVDETKEERRETIDGIDIMRGRQGEIFQDGGRFKGADCVIWSASPLTAFFRGRFARLNSPLILLYTGPLYPFSQVLQAHAQGVPFSQLASHYKNALVPLGLTSVLVRAPFVRVAVSLSERNAGILREKGCPAGKLRVIPPGYDGVKHDAFGSITVDQMRERLLLPKMKKILTYFGSPYRIRGIEMLLRAFKDVCARREDIVLLILARTADKGEAKALVRRAASLGIGRAIRVVPGFLGEGEVQSYLFASDAVVLPFILVPSDMPLGALEAMALGKPVITTDIDGMPEIVRDSGALVRGEAELAAAISGIFSDAEDFNAKKKKCLEYSASVPTWNEITARFENLFANAQF